MAPAKLRLDQLLLARGLADSRQQAQARILAGEVYIAGQKATKPGQPVAPDAAVEVRALGPQFASRAAGKLAAALDHFGVTAADRVALDVGSSTGGFTDILLARGARRVHAVDSGTNQMIWRLRNDPRVHLLERTNARYLRAADLEGDQPSLLVMDVSFISATLLLPTLVPLLAPGAELIVLVKPQFEAGREAVGKGGIVCDPAAHAAAVARVRMAIADLGGAASAAIPSPVLGASGNQEFLLHARLQ
jgi:23S rRNA (cytidine1920-2'-O)/16S rRNA (cytidine1409-2'-O)-methyltransferase